MAKNADNAAQNPSGDDSQVDLVAEVASAEVLLIPSSKQGYDQTSGAFNF